jgi:CRP-like cAMP-binding protein
MINPVISYVARLQSIPEEDQSLIAAFFKAKTFKEDDYLFRGGRICDELFFICSGVVRIASTNEKGAPVIHYFYSENYFCTIMQSFEQEIPADTNIEAWCQVEALVLTKRRLHDLYQRFPYMKTLIHEIFRRQLLEKVNTRNTYLGEDAEGRYKLFIAQQPGIALRVPVKDIASFLGITPQSLSRIRKNIR